jgi:hypothetical protein
MRYVLRPQPARSPGLVLAGALVLVATPSWADGVERWSPANISSPQFESHAAFDPERGDLYFVRSAPDFTGWRLMVSRCTQAGWAPPQPPSFAGAGLEADPFFADGGRTLYFISTRKTAAMRSSDLDIWRIERGKDGAWGPPERLPEPVNSGAAEWFPRPAADGWLYFGSGRPGGLGGTDIWRARPAPDGWVVENLGPNVNGAGEDYEPLPSPDGSSMIVMTDTGLYETRRAENGWTPRAKLGAEINLNGSEIGALYSPSGRSLLFARDTKGPDSGEFFIWRRGAAEAWPPACPRQ